MSTNAAVVLVLEDEPLISMDVEQVLEDAGFAVTTIMSCEEAEHWLNVCRPDIAIVDIMLSDGPADRVAKRLVEAEIPLVVLSGDLPDMHANTAFAQGAWVGKPFDPDELVNTARALLPA